MRTLIIISSCLVILGTGETCLSAAFDAVLRTEIKEINKPGIGKVKIETTYRGNEQILKVMSYSNVTIRSYFLHGKLMFTESDDNGDGLFETLGISGDTMDDFEQFTRKPDGSVEPISKDKYLELKQKIGDSTKRLEQMFQEADKGAN